LRAASERGWDVPGQVSVTGWDNDPIVSFLKPSLTSVSVNLERVGHNAMARLIGMLRDEVPRLTDEPVNRVMWRESTGPADHS
jgi:LacI family transcriptional regulator